MDQAVFTSLYRNRKVFVRGLHVLNIAANLQSTITSVETSPSLPIVVPYDILYEVIDLYHEPLPPQTPQGPSTKRLLKELRDIETAVQRNGTDGGISMGPKSSDDLLNWTATILGPVGTPYEGGIFFLDIKIPHDYPFKPPSAKFTTKIYSPSIDLNGRHCLDIFGDQWSPALTLMRAVGALQCLLSDPNADDPMNPEAAKLYKSDRAAFDKKAREWTQKYAT
eukprot:PhF_6_TR19170/c0_g1_i2/m.28192/K06689/UBE2D, UBC4, UBC5; ubiquitin-conjugating enzyme E2 D